VLTKVGRAEQFFNSSYRYMFYYKIRYMFDLCFTEVCGCNWYSTRCTPSTSELITDKNLIGMSFYLNWFHRGTHLEIHLGLRIVWRNDKNQNIWITNASTKFYKVYLKFNCRNDFHINVLSIRVDFVCVKCISLTHRRKTEITIRDSWSVVTGSNLTSSHHKLYNRVYCHSSLYKLFCLS